MHTPPLCFGKAATGHQQQVESHKQDNSSLHVDNVFKVIVAGAVLLER